MTNKEATFLLGASRPGGASDPEFAEALAQASRDPVLKAWFEDQCRFDSAIAARLQSVPVPADLRSRILAGGRVSRPAPWLSARCIWAIAAMIAVFAAIGVWYSAGTRRHADEWEDQALATLSGLLSGQEKFDVESPTVADLQQWLRANRSPSAAALPAGLQRLSSLGCKTIAWHGHPISIICFHGPGGELVHLAMVDRAALVSPPPDLHPVFESKDGWRMACWSQGDTAMMLVTRAPESQLHTILGMVLLL
jgi:hypothetical protein